MLVDPNTVSSSDDVPLPPAEVVQHLGSGNPLKPISILQPSYTCMAASYEYDKIIHVLDRRLKPIKEQRTHAGSYLQATYIRTEMCSSMYQEWEDTAGCGWGEKSFWMDGWMAREMMPLRWCGPFFRHGPTCQLVTCHNRVLRLEITHRHVQPRPLPRACMEHLRRTVRHVVVFHAHQSLV